MKKISKYTLIASTFLFPVLTFAALNGVKALLGDFGGILNTLLKLLFGLALVYFFWGVSQFILHSGEPKTRDEGRNKMIWGIVALFVFVSIYGILSFIGSSIGIPCVSCDTKNAPKVDPVPLGNPTA